MAPRTSSNASQKFLQLQIAAYFVLAITGVVLGQEPDYFDLYQCANTLPGLDKMSLGIDVTRFDLFSKENKGLKGKVVPYSCIYKNKKGEYELPDQIDTVANIPAGDFSSTVQVVNSYNKTRAAVTANFEVGATVKAFGFSYSTSLSAVQNSLFNKSTWIMKTSASVSVRRVRMYHDVKARLLENPVEEYLNENLGAHVSLTDPAAKMVFKRLIGAYGTHYFSAANYGGIVDISMETKKEYYLRHDENKLKTQSQLVFAKILKLSKSEFGLEGEEEDGSFRKATTISKKYYGGETNLLQDGGFKDWQPTVRKLPFLYSGELLPISTLLNNKTLSEAVDGAIREYVLSSYLDELMRLIRSRHVWKNSDQKLQQFQNKIQQATELTSHITTEQMKTFSNEVLKELTLPVWFIGKQRICYEWFPGSKGQCKGPTSHMCVSPSLMTKDKNNAKSPADCPAASDTRAKHDNWFRAIQVCFRWTECKSNWTDEFCASVDDLTTTNRNEVNNTVSKTCKVDWKIKVPENSVMWVQNLRLCFLWVPDQGEGSCDGHPCVLSDIWTPYHAEKANLLQKCTSGGVSQALNQALTLMPFIVFVLFYRALMSDVW